MNPNDNVLSYRPLELMLNEKITKVEFDDFIGVWKNFMPKPVCDEMIKYCDHVLDSSCLYNPDPRAVDYNMQEIPYNSAEMHGRSELNRNDFAFVMNYSNRGLTNKINSILHSCVEHYIHKYQALKNTALISTDIKVQKTPPEGGFHQWHYENGDQVHSHRELVWMIYLNDMPEGDGETEFLYQRKRIRPTAGTVVVWPAGFTHLHKGNTVMTTDKYILTGWYHKNS